MSEKGKYIYGIIRANEKKNFGGIGLGDPKSEVYAVTHRDIGAVVSDVPITAYHSMTKDKVAQDLFGHQSVIEKIMENHAIVPMKFGTFAKEEEDVARILKTGYEQFKEALNWINNKIELDVMALWDKKIIFKEMAEEGEIKEFKERIIAQPAGAQSSDLIKLGAMVEKSLKTKNGKYAKEILCALTDQAEDFCVHDTLDDIMLINSSFVLDRSREKDFDRKLLELDEKYKRKINFRCVGPLAPYSFATIEVKRLGFEEIDKARKLLGLGEEITPAQVKSAHRQLVFKYHPDKNPPESSGDEKFAELTQAYKLLMEVCPSDGCSLRKEDIMDSLRINILRMGERHEGRDIEKTNLHSGDSYRSRYGLGS